MNGIDDSDTSTLGYTVNRLRVFEVWVHACGVVEKPCTQVEHGMVGVLLFSGDAPSGYECRHLKAETDKSLAMLVEVVRVGEAVATDVGTLRVFEIWPPVVSFGEIIVWAAC